MLESTFLVLDSGLIQLFIVRVLDIKREVIMKQYLKLITMI